MIHPGIKLIKWPHKEEPTEESVKREMEKFGYKVYDLQTIPGWFARSMHTHDYEEIRGAVSGVTTFHFQGAEVPITIEAGDILFIPAGVPHEVITHNARPFTAYKGSVTGERKVSELTDSYLKKE